MRTEDLLNHPDSFERRLRDGLDHIAHARPVADPGRFDPEADTLSVERHVDARPGRWLAGAAAAAVVVFGVVGLVALDRNGESSNAPADQPDPAPARQVPVATTALSSTPAAAFSVDDWLTVPVDATELEWQYAVDGDGGYAGPDARADQVVYGTATDPDLLVINIHNPPLDPGIESGAWAAFPLRDGWIETRQLGDTEITVQGADAVDPAIVDMLIVTPEQELMTEPIGVRDRATSIGTALHNGNEWTVLVERSGRYQMTYVEVRPSGNSAPDVRMMAGPELIPPGDELSVGYQPSRFAEMSRGEVLAIGRAPSDVSSVKVEFSDGAVVNAATSSATPDGAGRYWFAVTSLAGDSHDISVINVTAAETEPTGGGDVSATSTMASDERELGGVVTSFESLGAGERLTIVDTDGVTVMARYEPTTTAPYCVDLSLDGFTGPACGDLEAWSDGQTTFGIPSLDRTRKLVGQIVPDSVNLVSTSDGRTITPVSNVWWDVTAFDATTTYTLRTDDGASIEVPSPVGLKE